jgi:hypothetical protein
MKLIYLASPYSHSNIEIQKQRFEEIMELTAKLMKEGYYIYSPIAATHPMAVAHELPTDWNYWKNYIGLILPKCDELWIAKMEGWDKSKGVAGEIEMAQKLNIPIKYIDLK